MDAKITSVYDEGALENTPLIGAKGFSALIEADGKRVLVDTGLRDRYLKHNLEYLDIDPDSIDAVVVTQSHPDNCRALDGFLALRSRPVPVYAPAGLYDGKRGFLSGSIGLSEENRPKAEIVEIDGWTDVVPGVTVTPMVQYDDGYSEAFVIVDAGRIAIVSGRGHAGPSKAIDAVVQRYGRQPRAFIGAVLLEKKKQPVADEYSAAFLSAGISDIYLNHCTGRDGMTAMRVNLGLKGIDDFYVGTTYSVDARN